jgi:hypothetical protein
MEMIEQVFNGSFTEYIRWKLTPDGGDCALADVIDLSSQPEIIGVVV